MSVKTIETSEDYNMVNYDFNSAKGENFNSENYKFNKKTKSGKQYISYADNLNSQKLTMDCHYNYFSI